MKLIPAIFLKESQCIPACKLNASNHAFWSDDPLVTAKHWQQQGTNELYIVDLDSKRTLASSTRQTLQDIVSTCENINLHVKTEVIDEDSIQEYIYLDVKSVVLNTKAVSAPHFLADVCVEFPGHIMVELPVSQGKVTTAHHCKMAQHSLDELAQLFTRDGVESIVYFDIDNNIHSFDSMDTTPLRILGQSTHTPIIAAGGIGHIDEIFTLEEEGIDGVILYRSIYENKISIKEASSVPGIV